MTVVSRFVSEGESQTLRRATHRSPRRAARACHATLRATYSPSSLLMTTLTNYQRCCVISHFIHSSNSIQFNSIQALHAKLASTNYGTCCCTLVIYHQLMKADTTFKFAQYLVEENESFNIPTIHTKDSEEFVFLSPLLSSLFMVLFFKSNAFSLCDMLAI